MTILERYCKWAGWQGGTIHQALDHFRESQMELKDGFISSCFRDIDNLSLSDLETLRLFTRARLGAGTVYISMD